MGVGPEKVCAMAKKGRSEGVSRKGEEVGENRTETKQKTGLWHSSKRPEPTGDCRVTGDEKRRENKGRGVLTCKT